MSIQTLLLLALQASVFLSVLAIGMRVEPADLPSLFRQPGRLARSLLTLFAVVPAIAILVAKTFSLHPAVVVALVTLAVAPVGNLFTNAMLPLVAPGRMAYARGLFFASSVLSVILTPLAVEVIQAIYGGDVHVHPLAVAKVVVGTMLVPLGLGLAIAHRWPGARRWVDPIQKVSGLVLALCALVIITGAWSVMTSVVRQGTLTAIVVMTLLALLAGHLLGGPDEDDRTVLAHATISRHPGVAIALASLTDQPLAPVGVLLAVLVSSLAKVPYTQWRKRRRLGGPAAGPAATGVH
jgi:BASS family bile acid:Na+ symporter